ncbi:hypothetical protein DFP74_0863 [Nocardiopsis sp. Huas11]|nr:hypothetical protein DFP74_0863 [Nocardiopsis sp. Huas11]
MPGVERRSLYDLYAVAVRLRRRGHYLRFYVRTDRTGPPAGTATIGVWEGR